MRSTVIRRVVAAVLAIVIGVAVMSGVASAANGDKDGSRTGTDVVNLTESGKLQPGEELPTPSEVAHATEKNRVSINFVWLMVGGVLVLFMQAGFALVETGFTRAKNSSHTMMMNLVIFALGVVGWWAVGYALMFGSTSNTLLDLTALGSPWQLGDWNILAHSGFFLSGHAYDVSVMGFFFFQLVFMDATATIPTGAMAERWKFSSFVFWGLFASMILYPVFGNWVWGGGFLSQLGTLGPKWGHGAVDFAGSGVVHAMGGVAAFWGAKMLGPRLGKFGKDGTARAIPGHHIPMAFLGTFVLLVGWMGFNGASTFAGSDLRLTVVIVNTILASAFGCLAALFMTWWRFGKPDPGMTCNGLLAGLVAITAPCAFVAPWGAAIIGSVAGVLMYATVLFMERRMKIDDPVGAIAVHGANGLWGLLAVGLFADGSYGAGLNGVDGGVAGLFAKHGGGIDQLLAQVADCVVLITWCSIACVVFFSILNRVQRGGMRVTEDEELAGLDMPLMGSISYPDFQEAPPTNVLT